MSYYVKDNYFEDWGYQDHPKSWKFPDQPGGVPRWIQFNNNGKALDKPAATPEITTQDAKEIYSLVLSKAGCWPHDRVTKRTITEVKNQGGSWGRNAPLELTDEWFLEGLSQAKTPVDTDGDGIPDWWEKSHGTDPHDPTDINKIVSDAVDKKHHGYTFIEFYINELADSLPLK